MTWGAVAVGGGMLVGSYLSGQAQADAASEAAGAQTEAAKMGIAEQRRQFDAMQQLLSPYVQAGTQALGQQQAMLGLAGAPEQQRVISGIEASPQFQALTRQGESAILQSASATGGLRGGNVQGALGQFRPALLSNLIQQQFSNLGGIAGMGQASAAQTGFAGAQSAGQIAGLYGDIGAAQAGSAIAQGQVAAAPYNIAAQLGGMYLGSKF